ncbi:hypothetical protein PDJAM_G00032150 [Pangasius djambal]|uniref:Uncharacterized protein n=1 Tax=Pangasius djambal TaxID=1691987 RepID=A0ACC5YRU6_9TELE|nr:hypothetical protein [Pangasius djambal]
MSSTPLAETEEDVFDLTDAVPETERLDSSLQKAKAQLSIKTRRHRPSRSRLRDSLSSTEGEDSLDGKSYSGLLSGSCSPLHVSLLCPSPFSDLHPSSSPARKDRAFTFEPAESEKKEQRRRSACLLNPSSPTHLLKGNHFQQRQEDHAHIGHRDHLQQHLEDSPQLGDHLNLDHKENSRLQHRDHPQLCQEDHTDLHQDDSRDIGSDEPSSPTVLLDKKTRRRFLDLGVTLRRTYGKVRRERANRHAAENREPDGAGSRSSRSSGPPFVPFSWLSERIRGSGSPKNSSQSPSKSLSEDEELKNDSRSRRNESSQPYQSLSDHSDEGRDEPRVVKKKTILPFSSGGRDRTEKQNGVQRDKKDNGHDGDDQKLLTSRSQCKSFDL